MPKTVLVVDDSRVSRLLITNIIKSKYPDVAFIEASNSQEALEKVAGNGFDVATLDMNMPGMDGMVLASHLRSSHPDARIALITANVQQATRDKASEIGVEFVAKPISEAKVLAFVDQYMS